MKTILKTFSFVALSAAIFIVGGSNAFGQSDACADVDGMNATYQTVLDNYRAKDSATFQKAVDAGKSFLEKFGSCDVAKQNADWVKGRMPGWEKALADMKIQEVRQPIFNRFDAAIKAKNWDEAYAAGNDLTAKFPDDPARINLIIPLAWIGYQESQNKNFKYNANAEKFAKTSIEMLKTGNLTPKPSGGFGAFQFECSNKDECISLLTYALGYMTYFGDNDKQAALPYFYEATKLPGFFSKYPAVYGTIGDFYYDSVKKISEELRTKIADQKDTDPDDVKLKKDSDIKATIAMLNGYSERAMDAYSRAYTIAKADPKAGAYAANVYKAIQTLYTIRFQKQDGLDTWISSTVTKPFPDPTSPVSPIDPEPTGTTGGDGGVGAANGNGVGAANGNGVGAARTTGAGVPSGNGMGAAKGNGVGAATGNGVGNSAAGKTAAAKPIKPRK